MCKVRKCLSKSVISCLYFVESHESTPCDYKIRARACVSAHNPFTFFTQTLTHAGRDAKGDVGGDSGGQCLFALSRARLSKRNKSHVGDAT